MTEEFKETMIEKTSTKIIPLMQAKPHYGNKL